MSERFDNIRKEDIIKYVLENENISEEELMSRMHKNDEESVPVTIFTTPLSPLESITRYLKENMGKKLVEISSIIGRSSAALSPAYRKSISKKFEIKKTGIMIPLGEFEKNKDLSVLEIVASHMRSRGLSFTEIARILERDVRTIWTVCKRAEVKIKSRKTRGGRDGK